MTTYTHQMAPTRFVEANGIRFAYRRFGKAGGVPLIFNQHFRGTAVDTLVRHFAFILGARGVRVNAVAPGVVETDMSNFTKTEAGRNFALGMQVLKRIAQPDDIGGVVAFLASDEARWITGETIHVDGGSKL